MRFQRVTQTDVAEVLAFFQSRAEYVMFPLNNLIRFGLDGTDPLAVNMWRNADGPLSDVLSVTRAGMVMPYLPSGEYKTAAAHLAGRTIIGFIGPRDAARGIQSALGLIEAAMELDEDENHFIVDLANLIVPDGDTHIVPASEDLRAKLTEWKMDYHINILGMTQHTANEVVPDRLSREISEDRRVVLMRGDKPVATTAFNAALPDIVQVGGVYTPPNLRGQGQARRAVALHLDQARQRGVTKATLFASNPSAIAAYDAVGFKQIGDWRLAILQTPQMVQGAAA